MTNADIKDPLHLQAVEAIDTGDISTLTKLLDSHPELVRIRLDIPEEGYFQNPYLLWFVADNPIRHPRLPANIVDITRLLVQKVKSNAAGSMQQQLDYALGLVATGSVPRDCGVQIELMDLLIASGAAVGDDLGALAHGNRQAAEHLLKKGSKLKLPAAIGLDKKKDIKRLLKNSTREEMDIALVVAAFYGNAEAIRILLDEGADPNIFIPASSGFHSHATALHQAIYSGSLEAVKLLMAAGARLDLKDKIFGGTPLGWAQYMQTEIKDDDMKSNYEEIEQYILKSSGNNAGPAAH